MQMSAESKRLQLSVHTCSRRGTVEAAEETQYYGGKTSPLNAGMNAGAVSVGGEHVEHGRAELPVVHLGQPLSGACRYIGCIDTTMRPAMCRETLASAHTIGRLLVNSSLLSSLSVI
jgi:hypothetical protein